MSETRSATVAVSGRAALERHQVWCYLLAVVLGLILGTLRADVGHVAELLVWPVLALLLYATFTQLPLTLLPSAFKDGRFLVAALVGNFVVVPLSVWGLVQFTPADDAVRLGLLLVFLAPCTDWFITFTQLGGGDATRATALTPITLVLQLVLLPVHLRLLTDIDFASVFTLGDLWPALLVVLGPLGLALLTQLWAGGGSHRERVVDRLGWLPVPLLAVVILLVTTTHAGAVGGNLHLVPVVVGVAVAHLVVALITARILSPALGLPAVQGRTLAFSLGTRNSFIVLPFALSLPGGWEVTAIVVVIQPLVELLGMIGYLWFVPTVLFPDRSAA